MNRKIRRPHARSLDNALRAMRLYLGSVDFSSVRDQQRLYTKARKESERVADQSGVDLADAWNSIMAEAQRQGSIRPIPGQHM